MSRWVRFTVLANLLMSWSTADTIAAEQTLRAGIATADITPAAGLRMWGYGGRESGATGTLDPLFAKALVLKTDTESMALVTLDLGRTPEDDQLEIVRQKTSAACGISNLLITASHTHQAPSLESYDAVPNEFGKQVAAAIAKLIIEAAGKLVPVEVGVGHGQADIAHNRRRILPDGRVAMMWRNAGKAPTEPVDREYTVVRFDTEDGSPLAVFYHYACHPVVLGGDHLQYSADYVGQASAVVERELRTTCLFLQGACGDINPYLDKTPVAEGGVEAMRRVGTELGRLVANTASKIETTTSGAAPLRFSQQPVTLQTRWDMRDPEVPAALSRLYGRRFSAYLAPQLADGQLTALLTTVVLGDKFALVGMPGEIFVDFQLQLKQRSPQPNTLLVGYSNGYHAYFPTIRDAAAGGYGGKTATYVEVGAGDKLTNLGLISLHQLLGRLHDLPRAEDFRLLEWDAIRRTSSD